MSIPSHGVFSFLSDVLLWQTNWLKSSCLCPAGSSQVDFGLNSVAFYSVPVQHIWLYDVIPHEEVPTFLYV